MSSLIDITYQEFNRIRDDKNKREEAKQLANQMLKESTLRFYYDWDRFVKCNQITNFVQDGNIILDAHAQLFIDVAVAVSNYCSENMINELRDLATEISKVSTMVQTYETLDTYKDNGNTCAAKAFEISKSIKS